MGMGIILMCSLGLPTPGRNVATDFATQLLGIGWQTEGCAGTAEPQSPDTPELPSIDPDGWETRATLS